MNPLPSSPSEYPPSKSDEPPLHVAARHGDESTIRQLIAAGADPNHVFDLQIDPGAYRLPATPLMAAAGSGDGATVSTVSLLLDLGADPKIECEHRSAVAFACLGLGWNYRPGGDAVRLQRLLDAGCPWPTNEEVRKRSMSAVAEAGDRERLALLLNNGFNPNGNWNPVDAREQYLEMQRSIESFRGSSEFSTLATEELLNASRDSFRTLQDKMEERWSSAPSSFEIPLLQAVSSGNLDCVRLLLDAGADLHVRDHSKRTAIYFASTVEMINLLIEKGLQLEVKDEHSWSPLVAAVMDGNLRRAESLIACGADVNETHDQGYTVFMSAVSSMARNLAILKCLVAAGADPHAVTKLNYNAFHAAIDVNAEANAEESVRSTLGYLKELSVDLELREQRGLTPLGRAIFDGTGTEVQVLCELGANPNGTMPRFPVKPECADLTEVPYLFVTTAYCVHGDVKTEALLRANANPFVTDEQKCAPLHHTVALLCQNLPATQENYQAFFHGFYDLIPDLPDVTVDRDEDLGLFTPVIRDYVERFASDIPIPDDTEYNRDKRREWLETIIVLCAYESWYRKRKPDPELESDDPVIQTG